MATTTRVKKTPHPEEPGYTITDKDWREQQRARVLDSLRFDKSQYAKTDNPVFAWDAIGGCLATDVPLPEWARRYLIEVARQMHDLSRGKVPRKGDVDRAVAKATGFIRGKGRLNFFRDASQPGHEILIAAFVYQCRTINWRKQLDGLEGTSTFRVWCEEGATLHNHTCACGRKIGWKTAERNFRKYAKAVIPSRLQARSLSHTVSDILR